MTVLKKPAWSNDVANHAETKAAMKMLRARRLAARRWHYMAVVAIDAIYAELKDTLASTPLAERLVVIAHAASDMEPFLQPFQSENKTRVKTQ